MNQACKVPWRTRGQETKRLATVLLVDDTDVLRAYVKEVLESTGRFRVVEAVHGREALGLLRSAQGSFAAIVLDCGTPGVDGLRALDRIRTARPDVPVIVVSADPEYRRTALDRGAQAFVEKVPGRFMADLLVVLGDVGVAFPPCT